MQVFHFDAATFQLGLDLVDAPGARASAGMFAGPDGGGPDAGSPRAYEVAEQHETLTLPALAEELVWDIGCVRTLLGMEEQRPRLSLVT